MQAIIYNQFQGPLSWQTVPDPTPPEDGVVIDVQATGLCRSDWHGWMGHDADIQLPHVPGHELAGIVQAVGAATREFCPGDRVTVPFSMGCGRCPSCRAGQLQVCDDYVQPGFTTWGSFAEYVALPHADLNLVRLPDSIDFVAAASLGCRYGTAFHALVTQAVIRPGQRVAVHGCGGLGLAVIQLCHAFDVHVIAVDRHPDALAMASLLGAEDSILIESTTVSADEVGVIVKERTQGGVDVSVDAVGGEVACQQSIASLRKRGTHVQIGLFACADRTPRIPMARVVAEELRIVGSHGIAANEYDRLLQLIRERQIDPSRLVTQQAPLEQAVDRLPQMNERGVVVFVS